ncbi:MAG TPA: ribose-phosphate pyrophosphokinase, partial [bacterium]|nr:ribose-phosphate pyrophosphokinase [bacterium]
AGRASQALAEEICDHLGVHLGRSETISYKNDNLFVRLNENVRETDAFIVQTSCPPVDTHLMESLIMVDALKRASARRITMVCPYFPYSRSDKKDQPRIAITGALVANLMETAGVNRVLTMDLHAEQIQGFFRVPVDQLLARPIIAGYFRDKYRNGDLQNVVAVAPDAGSARRVRLYAALLDVPLVLADKRRQEMSTEIMNIVGDVEGKDAIIFDDEIATGGSILEVAEKVAEMGATSVSAGVTHPVLCGDAPTKVEGSVLKELAVTNTIPIDPSCMRPKITVLSVARLFAEAILSIHTGQSVSRLFG